MPLKIVESFAPGTDWHQMAFYTEDPEVKENEDYFFVLRMKDSPDVWHVVRYDDCGWQKVAGPFEDVHTAMVAYALLR